MKEQEYLWLVMLELLGVIIIQSELSVFRGLLNNFGSQFVIMFG